MRRVKLGLRRSGKSKETKCDTIMATDSSSSSSSSSSPAVVFSSNASLSRRLGFRRSFSNSMSRTAATLIMTEDDDVVEGEGNAAGDAAIVSPTDTRTSSGESSWSWNDSSSSDAAIAEEEEAVVEQEDSDDLERGGVLDVYRRKGSTTRSSTALTESTTTGSSASSTGGPDSSLVDEWSDANVVPGGAKREALPQMMVALAPTFPGAVEQWFHAASNLARSDDVKHLLHCSANVLWTASSLSVQVALLPVTVPIHVTRCTTQLVVGTCADVLQSTGSLLLHMIVPTNLPCEQHQHRLLVEDAATAEQQHPKKQERANASIPRNQPDEPTLGSSDNEPPANDNLIANVLGVPWMLLCAAGKVKDDLGALVFPPSSPLPCGPSQQPQLPPTPSTPEFRKGQVLHDDDSCVHDNFLDRLRLDYHSSLDTPVADPYYRPNAIVSIGKATTSAAATVADKDDDVCYPKKPPPLTSSVEPQRPHASTTNDASYSKFLLPVLDLGLEHEGRTVHYVDLQSYQSDGATCVVAMALDRMVAVGLGLLANHPTVRLSSQSHSHSPPPPKTGGGIDWRPEGNTPKLLRKMGPLSTLDRLKVLEQEVLIWSGSLSTSNKYPFFLARGVVNKRPCDFTKLLWDNQRTAEYNNFCLGRTTQLVLNDHVLSAKCDDAMSGTKVVQSETRVPFTSLSVLLSCCMHVRPLVGADEGGFVIVSRSLYTGNAGTHWNPNGVEPTAKNEILWGINILRRVPNHPHLTDLTSLSQVGSTLVPRFLATRIGLMGIEDFFRNVRKSTPPAKQPPPPPHRSASC